MTRPYTRACRQTNFSEGGFVNKVPFFFSFFFLFFSFSFSYLLSFFLTFLPFVIFFKWVHGQWGVHQITQGRWVLNLRFIICQK